VTPEGKVKVLNFGLAKAFAGGARDATLSNSPTISIAATQRGIILGTAAYMSPEQARGQEADKRADIWAFGCVLYEMLTGRQTPATRDGRSRHNAWWFRLPLGPAAAVSEHQAVGPGDGGVQGRGHPY
jgi:serine/threonine protein kinase